MTPCSSSYTDLCANFISQFTIIAFITFSLTSNLCLLTGFHGFHVMMGGIMLAIMLARSVFAGHFEDHDHFGFEAASWYWHFVDVVWVMLFLFVYIL